LIPQLRELAGEYGVDGVWVDGECWASVADYGEAATRAYLEAKGLKGLPAMEPGSAERFEFLEFHREAFRRYARHYVGELKRTHPEFQLCSNWAFTDHMPEPVTIPLDFLSGDYSSDDSVNSARMSARYLARQGMPWDLMAWSFSQKARRVDGQEQAQKTAVQLQREAALVLALGGGFQAYYKQKRDGSIYDEQMPVMAEVASFCRARQAWCHRAEQVPQIALLFSTPAHYRWCSGLFSRDLSRINGTLQALLESQHAVEVLGEHHLTGRLSQYPLVIVPEWAYLDPAFRLELLDYVRGGGKLLLIGRESAGLFEEELGVKMDRSPAGPVRQLVQGEGTVEVRGPERFSAAPGTRLIGALQSADSLGSLSGPAAVSVGYGGGVIAATTFTFSRAYLSTQSAVLRGFLDGLVRELFPDPMVEVSGSHEVDVVLNRLGGRLSVHLINTAGPHRTEGILDTIPAVGPLRVHVRLASRPKAVTVYPDQRPVEFRYREGRVEFDLPALKIYDIVTLDE